MMLKVRISYFNRAPFYDPVDYPEEEVTMSESEFYNMVETSNYYYDDVMGMHYTRDNTVGYTIIG